MANHTTIKDHKKELLSHKRACAAASIMLGLLGSLLGLQLFNLQVIQHHKYATLSKKNSIDIIPLNPARGLIYDRYHKLIAGNKTSYILTINPARTPGLKNTFYQLQKLIPITAKEHADFLKSLKYAHKDMPIPLTDDLKEWQVARVYVNRYRLPGVALQTGFARYYPQGKNLAAVIGLTTHNPSLTDNNNPTLGMTGIEKQYNKALQGQAGYEEVETDATGKMIRPLQKVAAQAGQAIELTINSQLQQTATQAFGQDTGALVALDPRTGGVLAMVSAPTYNPNPLVEGVSAAAYHKILHQPDQPLFNRALRGQYAIGSTIKPFFALAGLQENVITPQTMIYDTGVYTLPHSHHNFHDWRKHGWVNLRRAITVSCDTFFYRLAIKLGIAKMDAYLTSFGFGKKTHIDMPSEESGLVPTPAWKQAFRAEKWYPGDTVITGIGQGSLLATPLQLAQATAALANHGLARQTHLLKQIGHIPMPQWPINIHAPKIDKKHWHTVISAMQQVVLSPEGTGEHFGRNPAYTVAAKTGTSQLLGHRDEESAQTNLPYKWRNNHLFICFAPVDHPTIAMAIITEHKVDAAHIARVVLDDYFQQKQGKPA